MDPDYMAMYGDLEDLIGNLERRVQLNNIVDAEEFLPGDDDDHAFVGEFGMSETPLTCTLRNGNFESAEKSIQRNTSVEYLNDGVHGYTPLNLTLSGRTTLANKPRNLKLAKMLLVGGANVNLRLVPLDHGVLFDECICESPMELLVNYYLDLLNTFSGLTEENDGAPVRCSKWDEELLDTIGLHGEKNPTSKVLIQQTRELIFNFLDRGGDVNVTNSETGRTLFHTVFCNEISDFEMIERFVNVGAMVNLTDVHGTTPFMDVLLRKKDDGLAFYTQITNLRKRILLDAQNCSGQTALWRSLHNGQLDCARLLLHEGALTNLHARVAEFKPKRPAGRFTFFHLRTHKVTVVPPILAPILYDASSFSKNVGQKFCVEPINEVIRTQISPLIDDGWFCNEDTEAFIHEMICSNSKFEHLVESKVFQSLAIVPFMFGERSAGLRQKCARKFLYSILFNGNSKNVLKLVIDLATVEPQTSDVAPKNQKKSSWITSEESSESPDIPEFVASSVLSDTTPVTTHSNDVSLTGVTLSEPEMRRVTHSPLVMRLRRVSRRRRDQMRNRAAGSDATSPLLIDDNWSLRQNPVYSRRDRRHTRASLEGCEIEISREDDDDDDEELGAAASQPTVVRIHRLLEETNEMLERLQFDFDSSLRPNLTCSDRSSSSPSDPDSEFDCSIVPNVSSSRRSSLRTTSDYETPLRPLRCRQSSPLPASDWDTDSSEGDSVLRTLKDDLNNPTKYWRNLKSDLAQMNIDLLPIESSPAKPSSIPGRSINARRDYLDQQVREYFMASPDIVHPLQEASISRHDQKRTKSRNDLEIESPADATETLMDAEASTSQMVESNPYDQVNFSSEGACGLSPLQRRIGKHTRVLKPVSRYMGSSSTSESESEDSPPASSFKRSKLNHDRVGSPPTHKFYGVRTLRLDEITEFWGESNGECSPDMESSPVKTPEGSPGSSRSKMSSIDSVQRSSTNESRDEIIDISEPEPSSDSILQKMEKMNEAAEELNEAVEELNEAVEELDVFLPRVRNLIGNSSDPVTERSRLPRMDSPIPEQIHSIYSLDDSSDDVVSIFAPSPTDESWGGGPFSLRQTLLAEARRSLRAIGNRTTTPENNELIIQRLSPQVAAGMAKKFGVPPGLISCLELEMARLQVLYTLHGYRSIVCDRGCVGDDHDLNSSDENESEDEDSSLEFGSASESQIDSTSDDVSSSLDSDFDDSDTTNSGPGRHRPSEIVRSHSSLSSDNDDGSGNDEAIDFRLGNLQHRSSEDENSVWFSAGDSEHEQISRFVEERVDIGFRHSTDSDSD